MRKPSCTPPIHCTPCRVTYEGVRYRVLSNGDIQSVAGTFTEFTGPLISAHESVARLVRREAARQRRNCNARERHSTMKDLGYVKTPYGWE